MSNAGQAILTVVGTVVGFMVGYPALGFTLGSLAGNVLFPTQLPTQRGPKLDDLSVGGSTIGVPIAKVFGAFRIGGNIIWSTDLIATTSTEEVGGKGGPTQKVETTTYAVNFAVGLCEGPITGVRRIWAGGKLIYDRRAQLPGETTIAYNNRLTGATAFDLQSTLYLGTETQLPDPEIESWEGVGNVPAYRGLAYYVLRDFQLADYGNNLMATALTFEVVKGGGIEFDEITYYEPGYIAPFDVNAFNPFNLDNDHSLYASLRRYPDVGGSFFVDIAKQDITLAEALTQIAAVAGNSVNGNPIRPQWPGYFAISATADKNFKESPIGQTSMFDGGFTTEGAYTCNVYIFPFAVDTIDSFYEMGSIAGSLIGGKLATLAAGSVGAGEYCYIEDFGTGVDGQSDAPCGLFLNNGPSGLGLDPVWNWDDANQFTSPHVIQDTSGNIWYQVEPIIVSGIRIPRVPSGFCEPRSPPHTDPPSSPYVGFCDLDGVYYQEGVAWTAFFDEENTLLLQNYNNRVDYRNQVGPLLYLGDDNFTNQTFWEARYAEAVDDGTMPSGLTYPGDYPVALISIAPTTNTYFKLVVNQSIISTETVTLAFIVGELCRFSNMLETEYDSSDLIQQVDGYAIGRIMDATSAIQPLRLYGFFDMVESNGVLKFLRRGKSIVDTIDEDELCAHEGDGDRPPKVKVSRMQDIEIPRTMRIKYAMTNKDYEPGEQVATRLNTTADQIADVEIAVAMSDELAGQIADVTLYEAWQSRNTYIFQLSQKKLALEPTDPILIPIDGGLQRVRIMHEDFGMPGVKNITAVRDGGALGYTSYVTGAPPLVGGQEVQLKDTTTALYLDLPMLLDSNNDAGYYAALRQTTNDGLWPGATVVRSPDGGATYIQVAAATRQSVTGFTTTYQSAGGLVDFPFLPPADIETIDFNIEIIVDLDLTDMILTSTTEDGILAGLNSAAVGLDGRWEIIQFLNAENISTSSENVWKLTGLTRGRKGTDSIMNQILGVPGDRFVLLNHLVRATQEISGIGASRLLKAVTSGGDINAVAPVSFTGNGVALKPYGPCMIEGERDISDNLTLTWVRRSRFGQELPSGSDVSLGEETEAYEIDVFDFDEVTVLRTITGLTSPTYVYSAADQTIDFGAPTTGYFFNIFQMSAIVGRGFPTMGRNI